MLELEHGQGLECARAAFAHLLLDFLAEAYRIEFFVVVVNQPKQGSGSSKKLTNQTS